MTYFRKRQSYQISDAISHYIYSLQNCDHYTVERAPHMNTQDTIAVSTLLSTLYLIGQYKDPQFTHSGN